ncbi:hypothetical protein ABEF79_07920 [Acinetobacter sp. ANC 7454]|uniref:hypothetical protein n=1 Tax=Acinetobacter thermotolerans TaxID=3151487 RepID=UPI00325AF305
MKKQCVVVGLALALCGCGDGSDDIFRGVDGSSSSRLTGVYSGSFTDENLSQRSVLGVIEKNSNFWLLYSPSGSSGYAGVMRGRFSLSGNNFNANGIRNYNFDLNTTSTAVLNGSYTAERNLQGNVNNSINQPFNLIYNSELSQDHTGISSLVGRYSGLTTTLLNSVTTTVNIDSSGVISGIVGEQEKCAFAGRVSSENNAPYYKIHLVFTGSAGTNCLIGEQEVDGILLNQIESQSIYIVTENSNQQDAALFIGRKLAD